MCLKKYYKIYACIFLYSADKFLCSATLILPNAVLILPDHKTQPTLKFITFPPTVVQNKTKILPFIKLPRSSRKAQRTHRRAPPGSSAFRQSGSIIATSDQTNAAN